MSPVVLATAAAAAVALLILAVAGAALGLRRARDRRLAHRIRRAAAPLAGGLAEEEGAAEESIFRPAKRRSRIAAFWSRLEARYPLVRPKQALPAMAAAGAGAAAAAWVSMWLLQVPAGWWTMPACGLVGVAAAWYALRWIQLRQEAEFIRQFPEIVDQIVRLAGAGVPALEAIAVVTEDAQEPVKPILASVRDGLLAGLDSEIALRAACDRVRLGEFTLFAAVIRLQRRAGGGISTAFANLAETLRDRRRTSLKTNASTAQTRLTLLILIAMPVIVLVAQKFIAPESVDILFNTEQGATLLRWGVALIAAGFLVARGIAAKGAR